MSVLRQIVYGSSSFVPASADTLASILESSRRNNQAVGVTGALLYDDGCFLQVLEGEPETVGKVYGRVLADSRHRRVLKLLDRTVSERAFPDWAMGMVEVNSLSEADRAVVRTFAELDTAEPGPVRHLLASFKSLTGGRGAVRA